MAKRTVPIIQSHARVAESFIDRIIMNAEGWDKLKVALKYIEKLDVTNWDAGAKEQRADMMKDVRDAIERAPLKETRQYVADEYLRFAELQDKTKGGE